MPMKFSTQASSAIQNIRAAAQVRVKEARLPSLSYGSVADALVALDDDAQELEQTERSAEALHESQQELEGRYTAGSGPLYALAVQDCKTGTPTSLMSRRGPRG